MFENCQTFMSMVESSVHRKYLKNRVSQRIKKKKYKKKQKKKQDEEN